MLKNKVEIKEKKYLDCEEKREWKRSKDDESREESNEDSAAARTLSIPFTVYTNRGWRKLNTQM